MSILYEETEPFSDVDLVDLVNPVDVRSVRRVVWQNAHRALRLWVVVVIFPLCLGFGSVVIVRHFAERRMGVVFSGPRAEIRRGPTGLWGVLGTVGLGAALG